MDKAYPKGFWQDSAWSAIWKDKCLHPASKIKYKANLAIQYKGIYVAKLDLIKGTL